MGCVIDAAVIAVAGHALTLESRTSHMLVVTTEPVGHMVLQQPYLYCRSIKSLRCTFAGLRDHSKHHTKKLTMCETINFREPTTTAFNSTSKPLSEINPITNMIDVEANEYIISLVGDLDFRRLTDFSCWIPFP